MQTHSGGGLKNLYPLYIIKNIKINNKIHNFVTISGNITRPGQYAFAKKMTLKNLIEKAEGVKEDNINSKIDIFRYISDDKTKLFSIPLKKASDFELKEWDIMKTYTNYDIYGNQIIYIEGYVNNPGKYSLPKNATLKDTLFWAKLKTNIRNFIIEVSRPTENVTFDKFIFKNDAITLSNKKAFLLKHNDRINFRANSSEISIKTVSIEGQVKYPGKYILTNDENLHDVIERARGLLPNAFPKRLVLTRKYISKKLISTNQKILLKEKKRAHFNQQKGLEKALAEQPHLSFPEENTLLSQGRIILKNYSYEINKQREFPIKLKNSDSIFIPEIPDSVQIVGGVLNQSSILFIPGKKVKFYTSTAGGFSEYANKNRTYQIKSNGTMLREIENIEPGDRIFTAKKQIQYVDWVSFFSNISTTLFNLATTLTILGIIQI
jgi:protein involved in polysaccharide export with SLBB domain